MSLSILNNIAALYAQNNLNSTGNSLQNTLNQLSSGSKINSGADDAAGLAVADGLHANEMALTQSAANASSGIGLLQTADGSLSQVTNLLDRAVTLSTEVSNGTLTAAQGSSANQEYQNILTQIGNIGSHTNYNSTGVFSATAQNVVVSDGTSAGLNTYKETVGILTTGSVGTSVGSTTAQVGGVVTAVTAPSSHVDGVAGTTAATMTLTFGNSGDFLGGSVAFVKNSQTVDLTIKANSDLTSAASQMTTQLTAAGAGVTAAVSGATIVFTATAKANDLLGSTTANISDTTPITTPASSTIGAGADFTAAGVSTLNYANAGAILTTTTAAIAAVAYQRGTLGADINQLTSAAAVASSESVNLTSAEQSIRSTNYGQAASDLSKYQILSQTGISALAQANSVQQQVLKLLQ